MRLVISACLVLALLASLQGPAGSAPPVLTKAPLPNRETLARLGLKLHWQTYLPLGGVRDSIEHLQVVGEQLIAQTSSGSVTALDAETGRRQWSAQVSEPYRFRQEPANHNDHSIFVNIGAKLTGLDRRGGSTLWTIDLPDIPTTRADADNEFLYVNLVRGRMQAYRLPQIRDLGSVSTTGVSKLQEETLARGYNLRRAILRTPEPIWSYQGDSLLRVPPVVMPTHVILVDKAGRVLSLEKEFRALAGEATVGQVTVPLGYDRRAVYIGSEDFNVYAYELNVGALERRWVLSAGGPITQRPEVMGDDLFVDVRGRGLVRLSKMTGRLFWRQPRAEKFIAASLGLVFAQDSRGTLLSIDRAKGIVLGEWDVSGYALIIPNDTTDRLYLANHDGLVVCLRDQSAEHDKPIQHNPRPKAVAKPESPLLNGKPKEGEKPDPMP